MITKEDYIRRLIKKQLLKESVPGTQKIIPEIKLDANFNLKTLDIYKSGQYKDILKEFCNIIEEKKLQEFQNNIIQCIVGDYFKDSDTFIESVFIDNLKALDKTTEPWKAQDADQLVKKLNDINNKNHDCVKRLYNLIKPTFVRSGGWGAGKGEILSLLLTDPKYKSGGTGDKDLYNNDSDFIELKQVSTASTKINININSFTGKQIALDFQENLMDIKNSINIFKDILEEDFIKTDLLQQNNWQKEFFDDKGKIKEINNPIKGNSLLEKFDESLKDTLYKTDLYKILSKFIFEDYNKSEYVEVAFFEFQNGINPIDNLKNISRVKEGNIFPVYIVDNSNNLTIDSYTNDLYSSIKNTYDILKDNTGQTIDQKFSQMYTKGTKYVAGVLKSIYENKFVIIKKFLSSIKNTDLNTKWFEDFILPFNDYFNEKINIINNPSLLKISLNQFSKGDFDTLFDDILVSSLDQIQKKLNNASPSQGNNDNVLITLDDGQNEIELITTINDFNIVEPTNFDLNGSIKNINNTIKKIELSQIQFANNSMKKKIEDKKYKKFFSINENRNKINQNLHEEKKKKITYKTRLFPVIYSQNSYSDLIDKQNYQNILKYDKNSKIKKSPLLEKIDNLIANLICLEWSISDFFQSGLVAILEDSGTIKESGVVRSEIKDMIRERIKTGKGSIDLFDNNKLKVEVKSLFGGNPDCLLSKLLTTRDNMKTKIEAINKSITIKNVQTTNNSTTTNSIP